MPNKRAGCAAAVLPDARIMVLGGYDDRGTHDGVLSDCDVYDPFTGKWSARACPNLLRGRWGLGCAVIDDQVYAVGGCAPATDSEVATTRMKTLRSCEMYLFGSDQWRRVAPLQLARAGARVLSLKHRYLVAIGGCPDVFTSSGAAAAVDSLEIFDRQTGSWTLLQTKLATPRTCAAVAAINDNQLLIAGGESADVTSSVELCQLNFADDRIGIDTQISEAPVSTSKIIGSLPEARMGCQAALLHLPPHGSTFPLNNHRCMIIVGGEGRNDAPSELFTCIYDIETAKWRESSLFPATLASRTAAAVCVGKGKAVPFYGCTN